MIFLSGKPYSKYLKVKEVFNMNNSNIILNRIFTQSVFSDLITSNNNKIYDSIIERYLGDTQYDTNGQIICKIYKYMSHHYRNEYFYQNTILNKLLLGRHSINTTTALTQVPIGKSKADFIMINGKAIVYEIKTELDSFERLNTQINDYYKAFNRVCVVTCEQNFKKLSNLLIGTPVGICILSNKNTLRFLKEPEEYNDMLSYNALFKTLHKKEFEEILLKYHSTLPHATPVFYYDECFSMFSKIPINILYKMILSNLKKRAKIRQEYYNEVPYELKSLMYFYNAKEKDYLNLYKFLNIIHRR